MMISLKPEINKQTDEVMLTKIKKDIKEILIPRVIAKLPIQTFKIYLLM